MTFAGKILPGIGGEVLNWIIAFMLIVALALSALNAIMGSGRALYQMALDGEFPNWFTKQSTSMACRRAPWRFNVIASLVVVLVGGAVEIYSFSNVGYTVSFIPVLIGYFLLRQDKPDHAPALQAAGVHEIRGPGAGRGLLRLLAASAASGTPSSAMSRSTTGLGWVTLFAYLPLLLVSRLCRGQAQPGMSAVSGARRQPAFAWPKRA